MFPIKNKQQTEIKERQLQLLKKGFRLGRYKFNRDVLYKRQQGN